MKKDEVCKWLEFARTRSGEQIIRFRKPWHTDNPSIQGVWHPFLNKDPAINVKTFPDKELSEYIETELSATEKLRRMADELKNVKLIEEDGSLEHAEDSAPGQRIQSAV